MLGKNNIVILSSIMRFLHDKDQKRSSKSTIKSVIYSENIINI